MNYIFPLLFAIAFYLFKRQERRHAFERSLFYSFEQIHQQMIVPKRDMIESFLILFVGATLLEIGLVFLRTFMLTRQDENVRKIMQNEIAGQVMFTAILVGCGIGMLFLGVKSIVINYRYRKFRDHQLEFDENTNPDQN